MKKTKQKMVLMFGFMFITGLLILLGPLSYNLDSYLFLNAVKYYQLINGSTSNVQEQYQYMGMPTGLGFNNINQTKEPLFLYNKGFNPEKSDGAATEASEESVRSVASVGSGALGPKEAMGPVPEQVGTNDLSLLESKKSLFSKGGWKQASKWFLSSIFGPYADPFSTNETLVRSPADLEEMECEQARAISRITALEAEVAKKRAVEAATTVAMLELNPPVDEAEVAKAKATARITLNQALAKKAEAASAKILANEAEEDEALKRVGDGKWLQEQSKRLEIHKIPPITRLYTTELPPQLPKNEKEFDIRDYDLTESLSNDKHSDAESSSVISSQIHSDDSLELIQKKMEINALTEQLKLEKKLPKKIRSGLSYHDSDLSSSIHSDDHRDTIKKKIDRLETREREKMLLEQEQKQEQEMISVTKETKETLTSNNKRSFKEDSDQDTELKTNKRSKK